MMKYQYAGRLLACALMLIGPLFCSTLRAQDQDQLLEYFPAEGKSNGKKVVLISGDEEYRSEESLPMLARLLNKQGFHTIVLFSIYPPTGEINPYYHQNIPGLEELGDADLMLIATRFRTLPDEQMVHIDRYLKSGKPVIGLRTATHAFNFSADGPSGYKHYSYNYDQGDWKGGFGLVVLGETWVEHHGVHGVEGTRAQLMGTAKEVNHPILSGVDDIWVPSDVYRISSSLKDADILLLGLVTKSLDALSSIIWQKSSMPIAWLRSYQLPDGGKKGMAFCTTMGAAVDLQSEDLRRLIVNASFYLTGLEKEISPRLNVEIVGDYEPSMFGFGQHQKNKRPSDYR